MFFATDRSYITRRLSKLSKGNWLSYVQKMRRENVKEVNLLRLLILLAGKKKQREHMLKGDKLERREGSTPIINKAPRMSENTRIHHPKK